MNADEKLNKIKAFLGFGVKLESMKLDNGTVIEAESFEAGFEVFIVSEDTKTALPVGDYTLEDGRLLVVSEEGIIAEIKDAPAEEEAPAEEPAEAPALSMEELSKSFVSKSDFDKAIEDLKKLLTPSEEVKASKIEEEIKVEEEIKEEVELTVHSPEAQTPKKEIVKFGKGQTPQDRIYGMINNAKK